MRRGFGTAYHLRVRILLCACVALVACKPRDSVTVDAPMADVGGGGACTGAAYDPCTTNDQCMSANCHFFMMSSFTVCVTTCTPGNNATCPVDSSGVNGTCNNMGLCKPAMPNNCTR